MFLEGDEELPVETTWFELERRITLTADGIEVDFRMREVGVD